MGKLGNFISPKSLTFRIVIFFCIIAISQAFIMNLFFRKNMSDSIRNNINAFVSTYTKNVSDGLDSYIEELDRTSKIILGNQQIQEALIRRNTSDYSELRRLQDDEMMQSVIYSFTSLRDSTHIVLADAKGDIILRPANAFTSFNTNIFMDNYIKEHFRKLQDGEFLIVPPYQTSFKNSIGNPVFLFIRTLRDIQTNKIEAYSVIVFDAKALYPILFEKVPQIENIKIDIEDQNKVIISSLDPKSIGTEMTEEDRSKYHMMLYRSDITGWTSNIRIPTVYLNKSFTQENRLVIPMIIIIIIGSILLALYIFYSVLLPIKNLTGAMKKVGKGDWNVRLDENYKVENIVTVYHGFNHMVQEIDKLTKAVIQEKLLFKDAQMVALRYQINPHFLYNTLQTIEAIAEVKDVPEIQVMSKAMGDLFRYNIKGMESVKLYQEIQQMDTYLRIESIRFNGTLKYFTNVSEEVSDCVILKFILQPIIENCIIHGIKGASEERLITIDAFAEEDVLLIKVYNNGKPIPAGRLEEMNRCLKEVSENNNTQWVSDSIGMINVHKRLTNKFGSDYGIRIDYSNDNGTCVILLMPKIKEM